MLQQGILVVTIAIRSGIGIGSNASSSTAQYLELSSVHVVPGGLDCTTVIGAAAIAPVVAVLGSVD